MLTDTENTTVETDAEVTASVETDAPEIKTDAKTAEADDNADLEIEAGDEAGAVDKELKTVRKALEKRNRYINNQRQRIRALEDQMQKMQASFGKEKTEAPSMDKFESVLDYMKADQNHTLEQKLAEQAQQQKLDLLKQQKELALAEQSRVIEQQAVELAQSNPDFQKVISANSQVFSAMPDHINEIMTELDDGLAAAYALAKEGRLASLYSMPPHIAAAHLVQAEIRGQQYLQQAAKPQTQQQTKQPPKPIGSLKGAGKPGKTLSDMSPDELVKRFIR